MKYLVHYELKNVAPGVSAAEEYTTFFDFIEVKGQLTRDEVIKTIRSQIAPPYQSVYWEFKNITSMQQIDATVEESENKKYQVFVINREMNGYQRPSTLIPIDRMTHCFTLERDQVKSEFDTYSEAMAMVEILSESVKKSYVETVYLIILPVFKSK